MFFFNKKKSKYWNLNNKINIKGILKERGLQGNLTDIKDSSAMSGLYRWFVGRTILQWFKVGRQAKHKIRAEKRRLKRLIRMFEKYGRNPTLRYEIGVGFVRTNFYNKQGEINMYTKQLTALT